MHKRLGGILLASVAAIAAPALPANAGSWSCGQTVTADVVLTQNLTCAGSALRVEIAGTNTIHIDLNGHRIKGDGTGTGIETTGASSLGGGLSVTNGTITGFATALIGPLSPDFRLSYLTVTRMRIVANGNWMGRPVRRSATVADTSIIDSGMGGAHTDSGRLTVSNSKFIRSDISSGSESSTFVYDSTFVGGGVKTFEESDLIASRNTFRDCDTGIFIKEADPGGPSKVEDNRFSNCRVGASIQLSGPVSVARNVFSGNTEAGLTFTGLRPVTASIVDNKFTNNGGDGLSGTGAVAGTNPLPLVISVARNLAIGNAGYGINVSAGVLDGGSNRAKRNGNPAQCLGVLCTQR